MPRKFPAAAIGLAVLVVSSAAQQAGGVKMNPKDGQQYAWIPPGTSTAPGSVTITHGFWMGRTEVTVGAYKRFVQDTGESMPPESEWNPKFKDDQLPIVHVTWDEAGLFCAWAGGRIPSEAEWDYSARAGNKSERYGELEAVAWYSENSGGKGPHPVGQKQANAWGLFDMLGNVWEWTTSPFPLTGKDDGPNVPPHPDRPFFALRGGAWSNAARLIQVSARGRAEAGHRSNSIGARCVLDSEPR